MTDLEQKVTENQDSWLKRAFKEEKATMGNHLVSCAVATGLATGFSHLAADQMSDEAISSIATAVDVSSYWGSFIPQLLYRDRNSFKNEDGKIDPKKALRKAGEYAGFIGITEAIYAPLRGVSQYFLQKEGVDPATASLTIQGIATAFFTAVMPPLRYALKQLSEKKK